MTGASISAAPSTAIHPSPPSLAPQAASLALGGPPRGLVSAADRPASGRQCFCDWKGFQGADRLVNRPLINCSHPCDRFHHTTFTAMFRSALLCAMAATAAAFAPMNGVLPRASTRGIAPSPVSIRGRGSTPRRQRRTSRQHGGGQGRQGSLSPRRSAVAGHLVLCSTFLWATELPRRSWRTFRVGVCNVCTASLLSRSEGSGIRVVGPRG
jgi:hypothetical protein